VDINPGHFTLLRLAILRGLRVEQTGRDTFSVGSHSHPKHAHTVNPATGSCCCPAFGWCSHLALAFDRWMEREAEMTARADYFEARRLDFGGLPARNDLRADDKRFMRMAVEGVRAKYAHLFVEVKRETVSF
jgi:hypothetical protein